MKLRIELNSKRKSPFIGLAISLICLAALNSIQPTLAKATRQYQREVFVHLDQGSMLLESGQEALLFSSGAQNLFLSQVPKYQFNLVKQLEGTTAKPQKIFVGLPSPDPLQLQVREDNGLKRVCSPMYVYV